MYGIRKSTIYEHYYIVHSDTSSYTPNEFCEDHVSQKYIRRPSICIQTFARASNLFMKFEDRNTVIYAELGARKCTDLCEIRSMEKSN